MSKLQLRIGMQIRRKVRIQHAEVDSQPNKKPKKSGGKGSVALLRNSKQLGWVFRNVEPPKSKSILRTKAQRAFLERHTTQRKTAGKKGSIAGCYSEVSASWSVALVLLDLRTDLRKKPCNQNDAPAEMHGK